MTLEEIKAAVEAGHVVHWHNSAYKVVKDSLGQWMVKCIDNGHCIGSHTATARNHERRTRRVFCCFQGGGGLSGIL
jgi:hypothetical protein